jgi:hypothetical protein
MNITCPNCQETVHTKSIKTVKKNGINLEKKCPFCGNWFHLKTSLTLVKTLGLSLLLIASLLNIFTIKSEFSLIFSCIGFIGIVISLLVTFWGKQESIDISNRN